MSLLIFENNPQSGRIDEEGLDHRHPVDVPVESRALVEASVRFWTHER